VQLDRDGRIVALSASPGPDLPKVRRAQVLAAQAPVGLEIARWLLGEKLAGQARVAAELPSGSAAVAEITAAAAEVANASTIDAAVSAEARAASAYWNAWSTLPTPFGARDLELDPSTG